MDGLDRYDETDDMLDEESDAYYESEDDTRNNDDYDEVDMDFEMDSDEEKANHFVCQRAGTCCLGCEDCDLENECSMCEHDGNCYYCDNCTVADEY